MESAILGLGLVGLGTSAGGGIYSAISGSSNADDQADAIEKAAKLQAHGYEMQAQAAEEQAELQAAEYRRQAKVERIKSGYAQYQGDVSATQRSMRLAQDIGSTYANWAGNGLMVDGATKDTLGSIIKTQVAEGQADIGNIKDTAKVNVWTYLQNALSLISSANYALVAGKNEAESLRYAAATGISMAHTNAGLTRSAGTSSMFGGLFSTGGSSLSGLASLGFMGTQMGVIGKNAN